MDSLLARLTDNRERVVDGIVYVDHEKVGIVLPSLFEGKSESRTYYLSGPKGVETLPSSPSEENIFSSLIKSGSILFGRPHEVDHVAALLHNPSTSRTASYYCCIANNCADVVTAFNSITAANVLVIGCGGIGSMAAVQIAGAGVGSLTLVDPDVIEESNLNRQLFWSRHSVGHYKAQVLRTVISDRYSVACKSITRAVADAELPALVAGFDAVILSADEPLGVGQEALTKLAREQCFLLVCTGYSHQTAIVRMVDGKSQGTHAQAEDDSPITWYRSNNFIGPSFGPTNVEIAGVAASLVLHKLGFPQHYDIRGSQSITLERVWQPALHAKQVQP